MNHFGSSLSKFGVECLPDSLIGNIVITQAIKPSEEMTSQRRMGSHRRTRKISLMLLYVSKVFKSS